jgi:hypothetical protein
VLTRVIGGLGSDTINVAGDVAGDVVSRNIEGTTGTINHLVKSADSIYNGLLADGIDLSVARSSQGNVIVEEVGSATRIAEGGCFTLTPISCLQSIDEYGIRLATAPTSNVYVTVSGTMTGQEEQSNGDSFLVSTSAGDPADQTAFTRTITLAGNPTIVPKRAVVLVFTPTNWMTAQRVFVYAVDDPRPEGNRVVSRPSPRSAPTRGSTARRSATSR